VSTWCHAGSNQCLDLHGDPAHAELCVFSDGNHHMALEQSLEAFRRQHGLAGIFYCTTPPKVYLDWMREGSVELGNLRLSRMPDVVIGPEEVVSALEDGGRVTGMGVFAQSVGNSLLVRRGNPLGVARVRDLFRADVRLFLSNPGTEKASHMVYRRTICAMARNEGVSDEILAELFDSAGRICFGERIHHREAPQALVDGRADVAVVYHHLALRYTRIFPDLFELVELAPGEDNVTTRYAIAVVDTGQALAGPLCEYFHGDDVGACYLYHGLKPVTR
jgi:hypothetical protein